MILFSFVPQQDIKKSLCPMKGKGKQHKNKYHIFHLPWNLSGTDNKQVFWLVNQHPL